MQVDRLSYRVQEELLKASDYNKQNDECLFSPNNASNNDKSVFSSLNVEDLNVSEDKIAILFGSFTNEIIKALGNQSLSSENSSKNKEEKDESDMYYIA